MDESVAGTMRRPRRHLLITAMFLDTFGGGLLVPFELVYALKMAHLSLPMAGVILSLGAAATIVVGPLAGAAADRLGPVRVVVAANVLGIGGCMSLLFWTNAWGYTVAAVLLSANMRVFWAAYTPLVASVAASAELERWFGRLRGARYIGLSTGQALSGVAFVTGETTGLRLLVGADAVSFAAAVPLILVAAGSTRPGPANAEEAQAGYRAAIADRLNLALSGLNVVATLLLTAPILALPVFVLERLNMSTWIPGLLTGLVTAAAAAGMIFMSGLVRGRRRLRNMELAMSLWVVAFVLFFLAPIDASLAYVVLFTGALLVGVGEAIYAPTADALPAALAPPHLRGRYGALHQMAWGVSETITPALVSVTLASGSYTLWAVLAVLAVAATGSYRALEHRAGERDGVAGTDVGAADRSLA
jgi:MFS family permease